MINEPNRHVLSDEPAEYLDERREQRFGGRRDCRDAVRLDVREHAIQVNAAAVHAAKVRQRGMINFGARERPQEQRVAPVIAHRVAQVVAHAQAGPLERGDSHLASAVTDLRAFTREEAARDLQWHGGLRCGSAHVSRGVLDWQQGSQEMEGKKPPSYQVSGETAPTGGLSGKSSTARIT